MTSSTVPSLQSNCIGSSQHQEHYLPYCTLQWRRGQLLVKAPGKVKQPYLPTLEKKQSLVECLSHSTVNLVCVDPKLGAAFLRFWADACEQANKPIFLRIPSANKRQKPNSLLFSSWGRFFNSIAALVLLFILSPIMLILVLLMSIYSPGLLFSREWYVGEQGKLFRAFKFQTTVQQQLTSLGYWLCKYRLQNLPQLWNVVRGEMSLFTPRYWTLEAAVRLSTKTRTQSSVKNYSYVGGRDAV